MYACIVPLNLNVGHPKRTHAPALVGPGKTQNCLIRSEGSRHPVGDQFHSINTHIPTPVHTLTYVQYKCCAQLFSNIIYKI